MAIRSVESAIEALAEVSKDNKKRLEQMSNQRRLQVVDIFGNEFTGNSQVAERKSTYWISISPDIVYLERFQFKIYVVDSENAKNWHISLNGVDITDYLKEQAGRSRDTRWMDGSEGLFPSNELLEDENTITPSFDIIDVANVLYAEGTDESKEKADKILKSGMKRLVVQADDTFTATILLYLKYSHLNR